jgi:peptide/nickel transport system permease protein
MKSKIKYHIDGTSIGIFIVGIYVLVALTAPLLPLKDPTEIFVDNILASPSKDFIFGTDINGMDILSRTLHAARLDLAIAFGAVAIALVIGIFLGSIIGFRGGVLDSFVSRILDLFQSYPVLILAIAVAGIASNSLASVLFIVALVDTPVFVRLLRSEVMRLKQSTFVESARAIGNSNFKIIFFHILPNALPPVLIQIPIRIAYSINIVAAMAFVGVGIQAPTPEWGSMIKVGSPYISTGQWWIAIIPGVAIFGICMALNLISDGMQKKNLRSRA